MKAISEHVYIEDEHAGAILGVISTARGLIQIDAPPAPEDARSWRASLMQLPAGVERVLINLDAHPDRTIGARAMDCTVIAHQKTAYTFRTRPNTFKAQGDETGSDWEAIPGLGSVRWAPPEITFEQKMVLHWGDSSVVLEHRPGPDNGAIWAILPQDKIVFVGDAVLKNQPPFLAGANLPRWIEALNHLLGPAFKGYTVVSSRGGVVNAATIKSQLDFLKYARERLEKLAARKAHVSATEKLIEPLLKRLKFPASRLKQFTQRLRYGLQHYYARRYHPAGRADSD
jgi:glyoxylase-like metal-dependent hydrolase (beta-lactamase superfamily II)